MSNRHVHHHLRAALPFCVCSGTATADAAQSRDDADGAYGDAIEIANVEAHATFKESDDGFDPVCERMLNDYDAMCSALRAFVNGDATKLQAVADAAMDREADSAARRRVDPWRKAA